MAAHTPRQQWNTCWCVLCALLPYKYKTKTMNKKNTQQKPDQPPHDSHRLSFYTFDTLFNSSIFCLFWFLSCTLGAVPLSPPSCSTTPLRVSLSFCLFRFLSFLPLSFPFTESWLSPALAGRSSFWPPSVWRGSPRCCSVWRKRSGQPWCWGTPPPPCRGGPGRCRRPALPRWPWAWPAPRQDRGLLLLLLGLHGAPSATGSWPRTSTAGWRAFQPLDVRCPLAGP